MLSALNRHQPVRNGSFVQRRMEPDRVSVRRHVIKFSVDRNDRRQTRADVIHWRKLLRQFNVRRTAKPLTRIVSRVWTIKQIRNVADTKPIDDRRYFQLWYVS